VSINGSSFVKNFLSLNTNQLPSQPYQFTFRKYNTVGNAFRCQLGFSFFQNDASSSDSDDDVSKFTSGQFQSAIGLEKRHQISDRWLYYFGFQALINYRSDVVENSSGTFKSVDKTLNYGVGLGGLMGVQFNFNNRVSLGTEAGLPIMYNSSKNSSESSGQLSSVENKSISVLPALPVSLFFNVNLN
jgi:hypothetical protein